MNKTILTLVFTVIFGMTMAQDITTYSVYDTNQSGDLTVSDVTGVVNNVKNGVDPAQTSQCVTANDLQQLLNAINKKLEKLESIENRLSALESKLGIEPITPVFDDITIDGNTYHLGVSGAVDLGISVKWAACNVGAQAPGDYGDYYAWGETEPYYAEGHSQDRPCTKWREGKTGYNSDSYFDSNYNKYATDRKTRLAPDDDVAHVKLGGVWRMPTKAEQDDLRTNCTWVWTKYGGHNGYVVVGSTGNAIFLPAAGGRYDVSLSNAGSWGYYWSSTLNGSDSYFAFNIGFNSGSIDCSNYIRYGGRSVRPVCP